jgi:CRISPR-associated protein (TIGR02710 family)
MNSSEPTRLLVTVGGSHVPVIRAVQQSGADFVCFVCSADDPATGQKGSHVQITGKGNLIKADFRDQTPSLPNIPTQLGLAREAFQCLTVSPDDFDDIYGRVMAWLEEQPEGIRLLADYTGGTKTMSAALVAAALDHGGVQLQLVTGPRDNLRAVSSGEMVMPASVENSRFRRAFRAALEPWENFAYDDAVARLQRIRVPMAPSLRAELTRAIGISRGFAAWDRFRHGEARNLLKGFRPVMRPDIQPLLNVLDLLDHHDAPARKILPLFDLWRNAQRRAIQQRYDDAVARLYRLLEWSAQWLLESQAGLDTADLPAEAIPEQMELVPNREGKYQAGLYAAWELASHHCHASVKAFWEAQKSVMRNHLKARNLSILAHGSESVNREQYDAFAQWMEARLLPLLLEHSRRKPSRIERLPSQFPADYFRLFAQ